MQSSMKEAHGVLCQIAAYDTMKIHTFILLFVFDMQFDVLHVYGLLSPGDQAD